MGFHVCEYCPNTSGRYVPPSVGKYHNTSSGDVTLKFDSGRSWVMPDMILHYVCDHHWLPPRDFIDDVTSHHLIGGERWQTKSIDRPTEIAYLSGPFATGRVPEGFVERLESLMHEADQSGRRVQYRGGTE